MVTKGCRARLKNECVRTQLALSSFIESMYEHVCHMHTAAVYVPGLLDASTALDRDGDADEEVEGNCIKSLPQS
jgi:hypothetical protein